MSIKSLSIVAAAVMALSAGAVQAQTTGLLNGGFEAGPAGPGQFAAGWLGNQQAPTQSSAQAHSGTYSALLTVAGGNPGGSGFSQNGVEQGGLLPVDPLNWGTSPTLTFWYMGNASETGNFNYALRYLDSVGNILNGASAGSVTLATGNVDRAWTQVTRSILIPNNTSAVFLEMTLAAGPSGTFEGCGPTGSFCNWGTPAIYVDDVNLTLAYPAVTPIPEPESYAMMLAGLALIGSIVHRRRRTTVV